LKKFNFSYFPAFRQNYEEIIYENLKKKFRQFISDLQGEDWLPDKPNKKPNMYVDGMIAYISVSKKSILIINFLINKIFIKI